MDEKENTLREKVNALLDEWEAGKMTRGELERRFKIELRADEVHQAFPHAAWEWCYNFARLEVDASAPKHSASEIDEMRTRQEESEYAHADHAHLS